MESKKLNLYIALSYIGVLLLFFLNIKNVFFWDTIQLGSKHANHFLSTNFSEILLPDYIDSGHIPAFGFYLALVWKIFGKNLIISHLAMLPFVIGVVKQLHLLIVKLFNRKHTGLVLFLILLDPSLLSQMTLITPDIPLIFFFLLGVNSILDNNRKMLVLSISFLFLISMRGMMISFCLLFLDIYCNVAFLKSLKKDFLSLLKRSILYIPALLIFISYNLYHYFEKSWIGFHENSPWAECFEIVNIKQVFFNIGILGWRILDFGRVGIWFVFLVLIIQNGRNIFKEKQTKFLLIMFLCFLIFLPANMLWAKNLLAHRYLMPIYLSFSLLCAKILFSSNINKRLRSTLIFIWIIVISTGNLWTYPNKTSQGWDSTLAHLPYYKLRNNAILYLDHNNINFNEVCSFFPNTSCINEIDLSSG